jgi:hypothetical protein
MTKEKSDFAGPWRAPTARVHNAAVKRIILNSQDRHIADVYGQYYAAELDGYARLIAAAPELYKELKHLVGLLEPLEQDGSLQHVPGLATLNGARAALAKVEGK